MSSCQVYVDKYLTLLFVDDKQCNLDRMIVNQVVLHMLQKEKTCKSF